jgi:hypothetical protein
MGVLAIALVCGVAWVLEPKRQAVQPESPRPAVGHRSTKPLRIKTSGYGTEPRMASTPAQPESQERESPTPARSSLRPKPAEPQTEPAVAQADAEATQTPQDTSAAEETIQDALAQAALAYVAQTYGDETMTDPNTSFQEGQGMIEDPNEEDMSDAEDPTTDGQP